MDQLTRLFQNLTWPQRIWLAVAAIAVIGGLSVFSHWNQERDLRPLFTDLTAEDAGTLVAKLKESGIEYHLSDNGSTIQVPSARVAEARLSMAAAGLPKSGRIGFELFDKTNFGASDFTEQVNYHRAIEGELERSVMTIREVEQARVHITMAKDSLYTEIRQPAKASVLVKLRAGARLPQQSVAAICQLTASAIPDLSPDQVSVVDSSGGLLNRPKRASAGDATDASDAALDYRKGVERDLQTKIAATLEPLLGADHFRIGVSADVDLTSGEQSEEVFDPQKSVMLTSQTTEDGPSAPAASGVPGTASNLPRPSSKASGGSSNYSRRTENVSYQTSRLVKHTKLPQGSVKRLSLSVLVDHSLRWEAGKRIVEAPPAEKLKVIHDLVAAATGLDTNRGDQLVVEAFPFESTLSAEPVSLGAPAPAPPAGTPLPPSIQKLMGAKNFTLIAGIGAAALLALAGGAIFALRRTGTKKTSAAPARAALAAAEPKQFPMTPQDIQQQIEAQMAEQAALQAKQQAEELMKLKLPVVSTKKTEVLSKHIAAESKKDPTAMAQVVRSWLSAQQR